MTWIQIRAAKCDKCGHTWIPESSEPKSCPRCRTKNWNGGVHFLCRWCGKNAVPDAGKMDPCDECSGEIIRRSGVIGVAGGIQIESESNAISTTMPRKRTESPQDAPAKEKRIVVKQETREENLERIISHPDWDALATPIRCEHRIGSVCEECAKKAKKR